MKYTLQRRLSLTLAVAILLAGVVAALASFTLGYFEAREMQDDVLRQIATLSDSSPATSADEEEKILVYRLPRDVRPAWLPTAIPPGFHNLDVGHGETLRVYVHDLPRDQRIVVAQSADLRDEAALNSALRTLVPVLLLLPLLAWLVSRVVASESQLVQERERFIADAAHELRTPLTALSVQARNLETSPSPQAMGERIAHLRAGIERTRRLTEQLLSLARTRAGSEPASPVDVGALARELVAEWMPVASAKRIDLGIDDREALVLHVAPDTLRVILRNALDNALRHTPEDGEVTVRVAREGQDALLEVIDTGPGIPESQREHVFEPFRRLEHSPDGSGLGLAIVRDAAARIEARVSLHERPGGGLVFRLCMRL